jgi:hypothetical protein
MGSVGLPGPSREVRERSRPPFPIQDVHRRLHRLRRTAANDSAGGVPMPQAAGATHSVCEPPDFHRKAARARCDGEASAVPAILASGFGAENCLALRDSPR